jgi:undecaprenyl-diphosphatase
MPLSGSERAAALLAVLGAAAFLALATFVAAGGHAALDRALLLALRAPGDPADPLGPRWLEEAARDVTALGSTTVLALLTLAGAGHVFLARGRGPAALLLLAVAGGAALAFVLKLVVERPRPDLVPHAAAVFTQGFPSAHAMMSAVTYATLGAVLAEEHPRRRVAANLLVAATLLTVLVGASRVYLGVHWPSDVLAGWSAGIAWASLCWLAARRLRR